MKDQSKKDQSKKNQSKNNQSKKNDSERGAKGDQRIKLTLAAAVDVAMEGRLSSQINIDWREQAIPKLLLDTLECAAQHRLRAKGGVVDGQVLMNTLKFINSMQQPCTRALFYSPLARPEEHEKIIGWLVRNNCALESAVIDFTQKWEDAFK